MENSLSILFSMVEKAKDRDITILEAEPASIHETETTIRASSKSLLFALYQTGGIHIDGGKLRLLGSRAKNKKDSETILTMNVGAGSADPLIFAYDYIGNFYAINVDASKEVRPGEILAWFVDGSGWESTSDNITEFMEYCVYGDIWEIFDEFPCLPSLQVEAAQESERIISFYPPLYSKEGSIEKSSQRILLAKEEIALRRTLSVMTEKY